MNTDPANTTVSLPIGTRVTFLSEQRDVIRDLRSENATLRELLIDITGQRNALQQALDQMLAERPV